MTHSRAIRIGTRGSTLARWQAEWTAARVRELEFAVEIVEISTQGDAESVAPISSFGGTGVFTKEIQRALLAGEIDVAVHSMKDLPTEPVEGLILAAIPLRETPFDTLVLPAGKEVTGTIGLESLPAGAIVGTGSLRRQSLLRHARPDLRIVELRGNVDTRLRKLDSGEYAAIVLAEAGLIRLGLEARISAELAPPIMLPAVGQGSLAIECRSDDALTFDVVAALDDPESRAGVLAERSMLAHLRGGCLAPIGAWGRIRRCTSLNLSAVVLSGDGARRLDAHLESEYSDASHAESLGRRVAESLLSQGAAELIFASRQK